MLKIRQNFEEEKKCTTQHTIKNFFKLNNFKYYCWYLPPLKKLSIKIPKPS